MNLIYPLGYGSRMNDRELMYSLRSVDKYCNNIDEVIIIGQLPSFLKNVTYIKADDKESKENNILNKINLYFKHNEGRILFMNDDHFLTKEIDAENYPYYYHGTLKDNAVNHYGSSYGDSIQNTIRALRGKSQLNYDIHCPIIYEGNKFLQLKIKYPKQDMGYLIKSLYCNTFDIVGEEMTDLKFNAGLSTELYREKIGERHIFSMGNGAYCRNFWLLMENLYPHKSKFEK